MAPETRRRLDEFYAPYNEKLARLLGDERYLWRREEGGGGGAGGGRRRALGVGEQEGGGSGARPSSWGGGRRVALGGELGVMGVWP